MEFIANQSQLVNWIIVMAEIEKFDR